MFKKANLLLWSILLLGLLLRLPLLNGSFWLDEAAQALESARPLSLQLQIVPDFQPPLFHLLIHTALIFSHAEWWLRLVGALIPGLITIWATYQIGRQLTSQKAGWLAALLLSTSSLHIFYSQELRPYSLAAMWAVLSWLALIKLSHIQAEKQKMDLALTSYLSFLIFSLFGIYTTYLYPFLFLSQWVYVLLFQRQLFIKMTLTTVMLGLSFLPWLPTFIQQLQAGGAVRTGLPGWSQVVSFSQLKSVPLVMGKFIFGVVDLQLNWFYLTGVGLLMFWLIIFYSLAKNLTSYFLFHKLKPLLIWLLIPVMTSWFISFWIPVIQPKRLLFLLPVFYLLLIGFIDAIQSRPSQTKWLNKIAYFPVALLLLINSWSTWQYETQPGLQREDWRSLYQQITSQYSASNSIVVMSAPEAFAPWVWYDHAYLLTLNSKPGYPTLATGSLSVNQLNSLTETLKPALDKQYVLVFDYLRTLSDPDDKILQTLKSFGFQEVGAIDRPNIGFVRIYVKKTGTLS